MIIFNFSHPLTQRQTRQVEAMTGRIVGRVVEIENQIDPQQPLIPQVEAMVDKCGLSSAEWQSLPILVNPPSLHWVAIVLLAELHGRCGYFPVHLRLRPKSGLIPPQYEVAEVIDLQGVRDRARGRRS